MRTRRLSLLFATAFALLVLGGFAAWWGVKLQSESVLLPGPLAAHSETTLRDDSFVLRKGQVLAFELHAGFHAVEMVSNVFASVDAKTLLQFVRALPEGRAQSTLEVRFLMPGQASAPWQAFTLASSLRAFEIPSLEKSEKQSDERGAIHALQAPFLAREHAPLEGRALSSLEDAFLRFLSAREADSQWPALPRGASRVEVRLAPGSGLPNWAEGVLVRVAGVTATPPRKLSTLWERLSVSDQRSLASVSSLGEFGLDQAQKKALLGEHKVSLAPAGIASVQKGTAKRPDLRVQTLVHRNVKLVPLVVVGAPEADVADSRHALAYVLTSRKQRLRLHVSRVQGGVAFASSANAGALSAQVRVLWEGVRAGDLQESSFVVQGSELLKDVHAGAGTLFVFSESPVRVSVSDVLHPGVNGDDALLVPLPPSVTKSQAYPLQWKEPLRYELANGRDADLEVKVEARARVDGNDGGTALIKLVSSGSAQGDVLAEHTLVVPSVASRFDRLVEVGRAEGSSTDGVTEPAAAHVLVPPSVVSLEVIGSPSVFVSVFTRPRGLTRLFRYEPETAERVWSRGAGDFEAPLNTDLNTAAWFPVRPSFPAARVEEPSALHSQPSPVSLEGQSCFEQCAWEEARAPRDVLVHKVVVPRLSAFREDVSIPASAGAQLPLDGGRAKARVRPLHDPLATSIALFYQVPKAPVEASVLVDGRVAWRGYFPFRQGEARLPAGLFETPHLGSTRTVEVATEPPLSEGRFILGSALPESDENDSDESESAAVREVRGLGVSSRLVFQIEKHTSEKETFSGAFYPVALPGLPKAGPEGTLDIRVRAKSPSSEQRALRFFQGTTFSHRRVEYALPAKALFPLVGSEDTRLAEAVPFSVVLDVDSPPGLYEVDVLNVSGPRGFVYFGTLRRQVASSGRFVSLAVDALRRAPSGASGRGAPSSSFLPPVPRATPPKAEKSPAMNCDIHLGARLKRAQSGGRFVEESTQVLEATEAAFQETLKASEMSETLVSRWRELGFDVEVLGQGCDDVVWVVSEQKDKRRGRGFYAIRKASSVSARGLQSPHSVDDLHTGRIATHLFHEHPFAVAAWNTVPRAQVDLSHTAVSVFQSFMRAASGNAARKGFVQLHGFDAKRRQSAEAELADVILGDGGKQPSPRVAAAADALQKLPARFAASRARVYARDVHELGGTTNVQARLLRSLSAGQFLHVEMSLPTRLRLVDDALARKAFLSALVAGLDGKPVSLEKK